MGVYSQRENTNLGHMHKTQNEIVSTLYLDFDNIYTRLYEVDPTVGFTFASAPGRWLKWIEGHALKILYGEHYKRRILKRVCYINPNRFQEFRSFFVRAGFFVVDCPPITNQGKTSADIQLVMECMDDLYHPSNFDEFIILSGDADFTPLLLRLQEFSRRTLLLSIGHSATSYSAAATWKIREDWFIKQAIMEDTASYMPPVLEEPNMGKIPNIDIDIHQKAANIIIQAVETSPIPVSIASIAHLLQDNLSATDEWFGYGKLKDFLDTLRLEPLEFSSVPPGYIYDPKKHEAPAPLVVTEEFSTLYPKLYLLAEKIHTLTDMPIIFPSYYKAIITHLVEEVNNTEFFMTTVSRNVRNACMQDGFQVARSHVNFVIVGLSKVEYSLNQIENTSFDSIVEAFVKNIVSICREHSFILTSGEIKMLAEWISGTYTE